MRSSIALVIMLVTSLSAAQAGPMPVGMPGFSDQPTPEWAKAHPKLTTAQTSIVPHSCKKDLHSKKCVKKCVVKATEIQPTGLPPIWHVRSGSSFPVRNKPAEKVMLNQIYPTKLSRKRQVQATVVKTN